MRHYVILSAAIPPTPSPGASTWGAGEAEASKSRAAVRAARRPEMEGINIYTVAICDDDAAARNEFERMLSQNHSEAFTVRQFPSGRSLRDAVKKGYAPDIALLDIELLEDVEDGIRLAEELFPASSGTQAIFITGYSKYCSSVYETDHVYFLLKPVAAADIQRAVTKAIHKLNSMKSDCIVVKNADKAQLIPLKSIRYLESQGRKIRFCTDEGWREDYSSLSLRAKTLPGRFIATHKSFVVNMDRVKAISHSSFVLTTGEEIPISRARYSQVKDAFLDYIGGKL